MPMQIRHPRTSLGVNCSLILVHSQENGENEYNLTNKVAAAGCSQKRHRLHLREGGRGKRPEPPPREKAVGSSAP